MAFYHVNGCSCPVGCCDCGPTSIHADVSEVLHREIQRLTPQDLWQLRDESSAIHLSDTLIECNRNSPPDTLHWELVGLVDDALSLQEVGEVLFRFYGLMYKLGFDSDQSVNTDNMSKLIAALSHAYGFSREELALIVRPLYLRTYNAV